MSAKEVYSSVGAAEMIPTTDLSSVMFSGQDWLQNLQGLVKNKNAAPLFKDY